MAVVNSGGDAPLDMTNLQIGHLQNGFDTIYNSQLVRVAQGAGWDDFGGTFSYSNSTYGATGNYDPVSGMVRSLTETVSNSTTMSVSGLTTDAPTLFGHLRAGDTGAVLNDLFGGDDQINGGGGADTLDGWGGDDSILAGGGGDVVRGLDGNDSIDGGAGDDVVNGNQGQDTVLGGLGNDDVFGGKGDDSLDGGVGDDVVNGNIGQDVVHGGQGADSLYGGQGNDLLMGDDGNDQLSGDLGDDTMTGGAGADHFMFRHGSGHDLVTDFNAGEGDRIVLAAGTAYTVVTVGGDATLDLGDGDQLRLSGVAPASFDAAWVIFT